MTGTVPNDSKISILRILTGNLQFKDLKAHLFTNNITPDANHNILHYEELTGGNYSSLDLDSSWVFQKSPFKATKTIKFELAGVTPGTQVYGYYISLNNKLIWSEKLSSPWIYNTSGDTLILEINIEVI